jgi:hypothetical protein
MATADMDAPQEGFVNGETLAETNDQDERVLWELAHQVYSETSSDAERQAARDQFIHLELLTADELDVMGLTLAAGLALQRQSSQRSSGPRSSHARW